MSEKRNIAVRILKKVMRWFAYLLAIPLFYLLLSLLLTLITVDRKDREGNGGHLIYLNTNGVHLDVILAVGDIDPDLLRDLHHSKKDMYLAFGWGDENFYLNTPQWSDLTFPTAFRAMLLKSSSLMHVTRYREVYQDWIAIEVNDRELNELNAYILKSFRTDAEGKKILLHDKGYSATDDFYKANGSFYAFRTCNSWVNSAFKESGLKACYWTPFDFGLMKKYED